MERAQLTIAQGILRLVDPHDCTDIKEARSVHEAFFDALVTRNQDLSYGPGLAKSWTVEPDARTWTFTLHEGITFHNGEACDTEAVKFSIERMARPDTGAALGASAVYAQYLGGTELEILDAQTLRLTTQTPTADLLDILVDGYILPPKAVENLGAAFKDSPIGTGAYRFVEWAPNNRIVGEANSDYFRGAPASKRVVWKLVRDQQARLDALTNREADIAIDLGPTITAAPTNDSVSFIKIRGTTSIIYFLNCRKGVCQDQRVRQALNFATDKGEILETLLKGGGYPLSSFVGAGHMGFDPDLEPYPHDSARARELLSAAGYKNGLSLQMISPTSFPAEAEPLSQLLVSQLERVGIHCELTIMFDRTEYANAVRRKEIRDLCCFDSSPLSTYRVLREKLSEENRGAWWQGYGNPKVDMMVDQARRTVNTVARAQLYRECYRTVHEDAPWLFLYDPQHTFGVSDNFRQWRPRSDGTVIVQGV